MHAIFAIEVYLGSRNNPLDLGGDPCYDPDLGSWFTVRIAQICMTILPEMCLEPRTNPSNFGDDPNPDYNN